MRYVQHWIDIRKSPMAPWIMSGPGLKEELSWCRGRMDSLILPVVYGTCLMDSMVWYNGEPISVLAADKKWKRGWRQTRDGKEKVVKFS